MPTPARVVSGSARLLTRLGFSQHDAYEMIIRVARQTRVRLRADGGGDSHWLRDVIAVAENRRCALGQSHTDRKEGSHANRAGPGNTG